MFFPMRTLGFCHRLFLFIHRPDTDATQAIVENAFAFMKYLDGEEEEEVLSA
jgi:hypothetical protein